MDVFVLDLRHPIHPQQVLAFAKICAELVFERCLYEQAYVPVEGILVGNVPQHGRSKSSQTSDLGPTISLANARSVALLAALNSELEWVLLPSGSIADVQAKLKHFTHDLGDRLHTCESKLTTAMVLKDIARFISESGQIDIKITFLSPCIATVDTDGVSTPGFMTPTQQAFIACVDQILQYSDSTTLNFVHILLDRPRGISTDSHVQRTQNLRLVSEALFGEAGVDDTMMDGSSVTTFTNDVENTSEELTSSNPLIVRRITRCAMRTARANKLALAPYLLQIEPRSILPIKLVFPRVNEAHVDVTVSRTIIAGAALDALRPQPTIMECALCPCHLEPLVRHAVKDPLSRYCIHSGKRIQFPAQFRNLAAQETIGTVSSGGLSSIPAVAFGYSDPVPIDGHVYATMLRAWYTRQKTASSAEEESDADLFEYATISVHGRVPLNAVDGVNLVCGLPIYLVPLWSSGLASQLGAEAAAHNAALLAALAESLAQTKSALVVETACPGLLIGPSLASLPLAYHPCSSRELARASGSGSNCSGKFMILPDTEGKLVLRRMADATLVRPSVTNAKFNLRSLYHSMDDASATAAKWGVEVLLEGLSSDPELLNPWIQLSEDAEASESKGASFANEFVNLAKAILTSALSGEQRESILQSGAALRQTMTGARRAGTTTSQGKPTKEVTPAHSAKALTPARSQAIEQSIRSPLRLSSAKTPTGTVQTTAGSQALEGHENVLDTQPWGSRVTIVTSTTTAATEEPPGSPSHARIEVQRMEADLHGLSGLMDD